MVPQHTRDRKVQLPQPPRQAYIPIGQIPHYQQGIRGKTLYQLSIQRVPLAMQIPGNGQT